MAEKQKEEKKAEKKQEWIGIQISKKAKNLLVEEKLKVTKSSMRGLATSILVSYFDERAAKKEKTKK